MKTTIEMPILSKNPLTCKTTGELVDMYPKIKFFKYTYQDPADWKFRAGDPNLTRDAPIIPPREIPGKFVHIHEMNYPVYNEDGSPKLTPFIQNSYIYMGSDDFNDLREFIND